jgi:hypothetical protein
MPANMLNPELGNYNPQVLVISVLKMFFPFHFSFNFSSSLFLSGFYTKLLYCSTLPRVLQDSPFTPMSFHHRNGNRRELKSVSTILPILRPDRSV